MSLKTEANLVRTLHKGFKKDGNYDYLFLCYMALWEGLNMCVRVH